MTSCIFVTLQSEWRYIRVLNYEFTRAAMVRYHWLGPLPPLANGEGSGRVKGPIGGMPWNGSPCFLRRSVSELGQDEPGPNPTSGRVSIHGLPRVFPKTRAFVPELFPLPSENTMYPSVRERKREREREYLYCRYYYYYYYYNYYRYYCYSTIAATTTINTITYYYQLLLWTIITITNTDTVTPVIGHTYTRPRGHMHLILHTRIYTHSIHLWNNRTQQAASAGRVFFRLQINQQSRRHRADPIGLPS